MKTHVVADSFAVREPPPPGRVGIILVNWNGWRDSLNAYNSLLRSNFKNWTLIVVDNASSDDSVTHLTRLIPDAYLVQSRSNLGFAGGCNIAVQEARNLGIEFVFFLNNDAVVSTDTLDELMSASSKLNNRAILGSVVRYQATGNLQFFGSSRSAVFGIPDWNAASEENFAACPELIESDFIFGAALFVPIAIIDRVGQFDERYFLNFEETDWCYRARSLEIDCFVVKSALTFHKGGASIGSLSSPMQTYFMQRNELLFCESHGSFRQLARAFKKALNHVRYQLHQTSGQRLSLARRFDPLVKARLLAIRDYAFRRFGDCPAVIRRLAADVRQAELAQQSLNPTAGKSRP